MLLMMALAIARVEGGGSGSNAVLASRERGGWRVLEVVLLLG